MHTLRGGAGVPAEGQTPTPASGKRSRKDSPPCWGHGPSSAGTLWAGNALGTSIPQWCCVACCWPRWEEKVRMHGSRLTGWWDPKWLHSHQDPSTDSARGEFNQPPCYGPAPAEAGKDSAGRCTRSLGGEGGAHCPWCHAHLSQDLPTPQGQEPGRPDPRSPCSPAAPAQGRWSQVETSEPRMPQHD